MALASGLSCMRPPHAGQIIVSTNSSVIFIAQLPQLVCLLSLCVGLFVQIVFRVEISDVNLAAIFGRRVNGGLSFILRARVITRFFDADELPRLIKPRVVELVIITPTPTAAAIETD